jgi:hypothetical protein
MSDEVITETIRLRKEIGERWDLTPDQMATIMASLYQLNAESRNWVLRELLTQEFYTETDMKEMINVHDQNFSDKSILVWLLSEITQHEQESVKHFQALMDGWHQANKYSFFREYLQHPYVCHQRVGVIWPWIARLTALIGKPLIAAEVKSFVKAVHDELPLAFSGKVSQCQRILLFLLHYGLNCNTKKEFMTWRECHEYTELKKELKKDKLLKKRDLSPHRSAEPGAIA